MRRIYYGDGSVFVGDEVPVGERARGVQAILQPHPAVGMEIVTSADYYVLEDGCYRGVDIFGLFDFLLDSGVVLFGRTIGREEYNEIVQQAMADKAGWLPGERKA